jgi:hypothetical protein
MLYNFRFVSGRVFTLDLPDGSTIADVKLLIQQQFPEVDPCVVKLVHRSSVLANSAVLKGSSITAADYIVVQPLSFRARAPGDDAADLPIGAPLVPAAPDPSVEALVGMGFDAEQSRRALAAKRGNAQKAVDLLLSGRPIPDAKPQRRGGGGEKDRLPSGMPRSWARRLATDPEYFEQLVASLIQDAPEQRAAAFRDDPAMVLRDAGLDPARFDVDGVKRRVAHLRGRAAVAPQFDGIVEKIARLQQEFPTFGIEMLIEIVQSLSGDEAAAREQLRQMMGP